MTVLVEAQFRIRGGTAAEAAAENPILGPREPGYETDTRMFKIGDGVTAWADLPGIEVELPASIAALVGKSVTGSGDIALAGSPTFTTQITTPKVLVANGTAAAPSVALSSNNGTGIFGVGGGGTEMRFAVSGAGIFGFYSGGLFMYPGKVMSSDGGNSYLVSPVTNQIDVYVAAVKTQQWRSGVTEFVLPITFLPVTAPAAPASGWKQYTDTATGELKAIHSSGTIRTLASP